MASFKRLLTTCLPARLNTTRIQHSLCLRSVSATSISGAGITSCCVHSGLAAGLLNYSRGHAWQNGFLNQRLEILRSDKNYSEMNTSEGNLDRLLLFQHEHVYTLGRGADENNLVFLEDGCKEKSRLSRTARGEGSARLCSNKDVTVLRKSGQLLLFDNNPISKKQANEPVMAPNGATIFRIERGGDVTYHGPGILVCYPLLDLRRKPYKQDLHWYLRQIEEVVIQVLALHGIQGVRDEEDTGVWVNGKKIAAVGVSSSRWITTHGFALNIFPDLSFFDTSVIIPCGIRDKGVTSIEKELTISKTPSIYRVALDTVACFQQVFGVAVEIGDNLH